MQHIHSKRVFAVKKIRAPLNSSDDNDLAKLKTTLMEHNVAMQISPQDCPSVVRFYGTLFREGDVWLLMELMDTSLDRFYRAVFKQGRVFPERILGMLSVASFHSLIPLPGL